MKTLEVKLTGCDSCQYRTKAKWIPHTRVVFGKNGYIQEKDDGYICEQCHTFKRIASNYCPDCGSIMEV